VTTVDPHRRQAECSCRLVIVEQALGNVHEPITCNAESVDLLEQPIEVAGARLVRTNVFSGDDRVELHTETGPAGGERCPIDVAEDDELEPRRQAGECIGGVGERGPVPHRPTEIVGVGGGHFGAEVGSDAAQGFAEYEWIQRSGCCVFDVRLMFAESGDQRFVVERQPVARSPRTQRVGDAGLPVDQGAVAVEAHRLEPVELAHFFVPFTYLR